MIALKNGYDNDDEFAKAEKVGRAGRFMTTAVGLITVVGVGLKKASPYIKEVAKQFTRGRA